MRRAILAGNWKMYKNITESRAFFEKFNPLVATSTHCDIVICPTFVNLQAAVESTRDTTIDIGGQNLFWEKEGAYTGEISGGMLRAVGCRWVLVAHSERREYFGETNEDARKKIVAALDTGLTPIYCVGEKLDERQAQRTHEVLRTQFQGGTARLTMEQFSRLVIAYEPCWAIGTGKVATPEMAADAHRYIREQVRESFGADAASACRILYGGSVKPDNIRGLMAQPEIDGGLVGGASLDAVSFASIVNF
jgi:triosephosphate isomerase (TIM)